MVRYCLEGHRTVADRELEGGSKKKNEREDRRCHRQKTGRNGLGGEEGKKNKRRRHVGTWK